MQSKPRHFTFLELLTALVVLGIAMAPFLRMFFLGGKVAAISRENVIASFLATEKLEEIQSLPFEAVREDFDNFREAYLKDPKFKEIGSNRDTFYREFSDIFSEVNQKGDEKFFTGFDELYRKNYGRDYLLYPRDFEKFRRVTQVKVHRHEQTNVVFRKDVTVKVFDQQENKLLTELFLVVAP